MLFIIYHVLYTRLWWNHFQQLKLSGLRIALRILLKYFNMMTLLCIPIFPPWIYFKSTPVQDKNFFCSHTSLIIYLISLNIILLDLFKISKTRSAF